MIMPTSNEIDPGQIAVSLFRLVSNSERKMDCGTKRQVWKWNEAGGYWLIGLCPSCLLF
jgi:hypothetical protein